MVAHLLIDLFARQVEKAPYVVPRNYLAYMPGRVCLFYLVDYLGMGAALLR